MWGGDIRRIGMGCDRKNLRGGGGAGLDVVFLGTQGFNHSLFHFPVYWFTGVKGKSPRKLRAHAALKIFLQLRI